MIISTGFLLSRPSRIGPQFRLPPIAGSRESVGILHPLPELVGAPVIVTFASHWPSKMTLGCEASGTTHWEKGIMIRTAYNNRYRDRDQKGGPARSQRPDRRDPAPRREHSSRRETATVVHPWMSLPDRLAATQQAMRELAGQGAFSCPVGEKAAEPAAADPQPAEQKPRAGVNVIIRKRRLPANAISPLTR